jgi:uncharacterized protein (TIGR02246 family)
MPARTPDEIHELFLAGFNAGDAKAVADLYEEHAVLVPDPTRVIKGRAAILDGLENFVAIKPRMTLNAARVVRNGSVAILYSDWTITSRRPDGSTQSFDVRPTLVAREQADGTWRIAIDDPSVDDPSAPQS